MRSKFLSLCSQGYLAQKERVDSRHLLKLDGRVALVEAFVELPRLALPHPHLPPTRCHIFSFLLYYSQAQSLVIQKSMGLKYEPSSESRLSLFAHINLPPRAHLSCKVDGFVPRRRGANLRIVGQLQGYLAHKKTPTPL